jgi:hypothetical protein
MEKTLVANTLENLQQPWQETYDKLRRLEAKFKVLCQVVFGINFKIID